MKTLYALLFFLLLFTPLWAQQHDISRAMRSTERTKEKLMEKDHQAYVRAEMIRVSTLKTGFVIYRLDSMIFEYYDEYDSTWYQDDMEQLFYNTQEQCVAELDYDFSFSTGRDTSNIIWYGYDSDNNWSEEIAAYWSYGQWDTSWMSLYFYSPTKQYLGTIEYEFEYGQWKEDWKSVYAYDGNGNLIMRQYFDWNQGAWALDDQEVLWYLPDGRLNCEVHYDYNNGNLDRNDSLFYEYNATPQLIERRRYDWDFPGWEIDHLYEYTYKTNGDLESRTSYYHDYSGWDTSYKFVYTFDQYYMMERVEYDWYNGQWHNDYKKVFTYDKNYVYPQFTANPYYLDDDWVMYLTENEYRWSGSQNAWVDNNRDTYYWSHTGIDIPEEQPIEHLTIYPVPATDQVFVEFSAIVKADLRLYDLTGSLLLEKTIHTNLVTLDVQNYAKGVYLLQLDREGKTTVKKLIIQ